MILHLVVLRRQCRVWQLFGAQSKFASVMHIIIYLYCCTFSVTSAKLDNFVDAWSSCGHRMERVLYVSRRRRLQIGPATMSGVELDQVGIRHCAISHQAPMRAGLSGYFPTALCLYPSPARGSRHFLRASS